jgi:hypothetical protein
MNVARLTALVWGLSMLASGGMALGEDEAQLTASSSYPVISVEYKARDTSYDYDESECYVISMSGQSAQCTGGAQAVEGGVSITSAGDYIVTGELEGCITIAAGANDDVRLILAGASVSAQDGPAINCQSADKLVITLAQGTHNSLSDGTTYSEQVDEEPNAALYSRADLSINGEGELSVTGNYKAGILSKDDLKITGGTLTVTAAGDALRGRDGVAITGGTLSLSAGDDGIQSNYEGDVSKGWVVIEDGDIVINATGDGISAESVAQLTGGSVTIVSGGGAAAVSSDEDMPELPDGFVPQDGDMPEPPDGFAPQDGDMPEPPDGFVPQDGDMPEPPDGFAPQDEDMPASPDGETASTGAASAGDDYAADASGEAGSAASAKSGDGEPASTVDSSTGATGTASTYERAGRHGMRPGGRGERDNTASDSTSDAVSAKGIKSGGALYISGGTLVLDCADDALHAADTISVSGGTLALSSGDDALHSDAALYISGGDIGISSSYEGLEAVDIYISGGDTALVARVDGINAAGGVDQSGAGGFGGYADMFTSGGQSLNISGGTLNIDAGGDGIDSNGDVYISGGTTLVSGSVSSGNSALDYSGECVQSGGVLVAAGARGMAQSLSDASTQASIFVSYTQTQQALERITLTGADGAVVLSFAPQKEYQCAVISAEGICVGGEYQLWTGGDVQNEELTGGEKLCDISISELKTSINSDGSAYEARGRGWR